MIEPTTAQVIALSLPGDDWRSGTERARRLLNSVCECRPCPMCSPGGEYDSHPRPSPGWVDEEHEACEDCRIYFSVLSMHDPDDGEW